MARFVVLRHEDQMPPRHLPVIEIIRDGWSLVAFILPLFWLLWHRLWFAAAMVFLASLAVALLIQAPMFALAGLPLNLLIGVFVGLEGQNWRIAKARRQGYRAIASLDAVDRAEAELKLALSPVSRQSDDRPVTPAAGGIAASQPVPDMLFAVPDRAGH